MRETRIPSDRLRRKTDLHGLLAELRGIPDARGIAQELERRLQGRMTSTSEKWHLDHRFSKMDSRIEVVASQYWENVYERLISQCRRSDDSFAVLFVDINNLGIYNKRVDEVTGKDLGYGHDQGDLAIRTVAELLHRPLGSEDRLLRRGGDEFIVFRRDVPNREHLETITKNYIRSFGRIAVPRHPEIQNAREEYAPGCDYTKMCVSIGSVMFPETGQTPDTLCRTAESMMSIAKARSKKHNTTVGVVYSPENHDILM